MKNVDTIENVPYRIGYSFRNPKVVNHVAEARDPYFKMKWAAQGPTQVKAAMWKRGEYRQFPTIWRRAAQQRTVAKLGEIKRELPSFQELGQAPGPTDASVTDAASRTWWGSLANTILSAGGTVLAEQHKLQMVKAQAEAQQAHTPYLPGFLLPPSEGGMGWLGWSVIIGGVGLGAYYYFNK